MEPRLSMYTMGRYGACELIDALNNGMKVKIKPVVIEDIPGKVFCKTVGCYITVCNAVDCRRYPCESG